MAAKASGGLITFGIFNILVALVSPCGTCMSSAMVLGDPKVQVRDREVGPEFKAHMERRVPGAKIVAFFAMSSSTLCALLLFVGAIGLLLAQKWGRATTLFAAGTLIVIYCVHDIFQLGFFMPAVNEFLEIHTRHLPEAERTGYRTGFITSTFCCNFSNPVAMLYLAGMSLYLMLTKSFEDQVPSRSIRPSHHDDDEGDDDEDRPRRRERRRYDD